MAASGGSADTGNDEKPTFTFEQIVLRFVVGGHVLALLVMVIEFGQVRVAWTSWRSRGGPSLAAATQDPLGSPQTFKVVLKQMEVVPKAVEVPAGTPVLPKVANQGAVPHNLTMDAGPQDPQPQPGWHGHPGPRHGHQHHARLLLGAGHKDAGVTFEVRVAGTGHAARTTAPSWTPMPPHRPPGNPTTRGSPRPPVAGSTG